MKIALYLLLLTLLTTNCWGITDEEVIEINEAHIQRANELLHSEHPALDVYFELLVKINMLEARIQVLEEGKQDKVITGVELTEENYPFMEEEDEEKHDIDNCPYYFDNVGVSK